MCSRFSKRDGSLFLGILAYAAFISWLAFNFFQLDDRNFLNLLLLILVPVLVSSIIYWVYRRVNKRKA